jgi:hypothetical protein
MYFLSLNEDTTFFTVFFPIILWNPNLNLKTVNILRWAVWEN